MSLTDTNRPTEWGHGGHNMKGAPNAPVRHQATLTYNPGPDGGTAKWIE